LLHIEDGFSLKNKTNDCFLPRQIDPSSSFKENNDEEKGVSKKQKKKKAMKPAPLLRLPKVSPFHANLVNPTRLISRLLDHCQRQHVVSKLGSPFNIKQIEDNHYISRCVRTL
jgi:hypothetical protein